MYFFTLIMCVWVMWMNHSVCFFLLWFVLDDLRRLSFFLDVRFWYVGEFNVGIPTFWVEASFFLNRTDFFFLDFTNFHRFMWNKMDKHMLNDSKLFEKQEIRWFCETELSKSIKLFRSFYRKMVEEIIQNMPTIRSFIKARSGRNNRRTRRMKGGWGGVSFELSKEDPSEKFKDETL